MALTLQGPLQACARGAKGSKSCRVRVHRTLPSGQALLPQQRRIISRHTSSVRAQADGASDDAELEALRTENAALRELLKRNLDRLTPEQQKQLSWQYAELLEQAKRAGVDLGTPPVPAEQPSSDDDGGQQEHSAASDNSGVGATDDAASNVARPESPSAAAKIRADVSSAAPVVIEYGTEGDKLLKAYVVDKGSEVSFTFETMGCAHMSGTPSSSRVSSTTWGLDIAKQGANKHAGVAYSGTGAGGRGSFHVFAASVGKTEDAAAASAPAGSSSPAGAPASKAAPAAHDVGAVGKAAAADKRGEPASGSSKGAGAAASSKTASASRAAAPSAPAANPQASATGKPEPAPPAAPDAPAAVVKPAPAPAPAPAPEPAPPTAPEPGTGAVKHPSVGSLEGVSDVIVDKAGVVEEVEQEVAAEEEPVEDEDEDLVAPKLTPQQKAERARRAAAARAEADKLVAKHDPAAAAEGRHQWLIFTVPEVPVSGADCVCYFNRTQSESLRSCGEVRLQLGFNKWELALPGGTSVVALAPSNIPHTNNSDFWTCRFKVPEDAYELNAVFNDGQGHYDNNQGQDFLFKVEHGVTWEEWVDSAPERAARADDERRAKEQAEAREEAARRAAEDAARDAETAARRVRELRDARARLHQGAAPEWRINFNGPLLWTTPKDHEVVPGGTMKLLYNSAVGALSSVQWQEGQAPTLSYGFNDWRLPGKQAAMTRTEPPAGDADGVWWEASVVVPVEAACVNFAMGRDELWDNNYGMNYKVAVTLPPESEEQWARKVEEKILGEARASRLAAEAAEAEKARRRAEQRKQAQDNVKAVLRRQMRHVLYTEPEVVTAGKRVTLHYNPNDTSLRGRQQVFVNVGFNRWAHPRRVGPLELAPPEAGHTHWTASLQVPRDAYMLDFVLSDVASGEGTYDNNGGLDYHLPVEGTVAGVRPPPLHVVHVAVEMAPIAKVGGLGDVVTALGRAVKEEGHLVEVILPRYDFMLASPLLANMQLEAEFDFGGTHIWVSTCIVESLRVFFIEPQNGMFKTPAVYGRHDDEVRFDFFCKAALEFLLQTQRQPDILHCHDWSSATVARAYWEDYHPYGLWKPRVVFTIHNMDFGPKKIGEAAFFCQRFTTVSPTYALEVGDHPALAPHRHKFMGIRNGIDTELWDPENNQFLPKQYNADSVEEGKAAARQELRQRLGLTSWGDKYIVGVVSRLTAQKGVHLIKHAAWRSLERGGQFVLLGSAPDPRVQAEFNALAAEMGGENASFVFTYNEPLSHLIYAACDLILVPSIFEPCGLTQLIAMRFGAVPVVRHTGGLRDTVFDLDHDKGRAAWEIAGSSDWQRDSLDCTNGFAFEGTDAGALDYALNRAISTWYNDKPFFRALQRRIMKQDWSWLRPALAYVDLYYSAANLLKK